MPTRFLFALALLSFLALSLASATSPRPNVILMITDDQGIGDFGVMGNELIETPHVDALAAGVRRAAVQKGGTTRMWWGILCELLGVEREGALLVLAEAV